MRLIANLMDGARVRRAVIRMAHEIIENNRGAERLAFIGVGKRGAPIAKEIAEVIRTVEGVKIPVMNLSGEESKDAGISGEDFGFVLDGATVVVVNDVLYTGRTVRGAIETVMKFGCPNRIWLAVLVDRGGRELPLSADYVGMKVTAMPNELVSVSVKATDGEDSVDMYTADD